MLEALRQMIHQRKRYLIIGLILVEELELSEVGQISQLR
jgi:hypothetical protein